ncbi:HIT-like protein [Guyanagaster necrorhizus]|uniref:HIT-like protein n=1 Tax=Guyanagaster necrorhizus TaxID=856835 RepID=A0A9P8AY63_9AGAR|nr:HIT-like protein [Guyanagaster necrorhizus MCA 3950]KAG7452569.1 HIT-like protein [Guyanagaster necrorhizus MCA 3950]
MANLTILRSYASKLPSSLPPSVLFSHTDTTLTIYDAFPKSIFHFLILPRVQTDSPLDLSSLKSLLKRDKMRAKEVVESLSDAAAALRKEIEEEMVRRYGFKWGIWTGFHAAPSMEHLHLHVLSADFCSSRMKNKKHYNTFHPKLGFFLDINEVLSWFDADPSYFSSMAKLDPKEYEALLKEPLECWRCGNEMKNMPILKAHLQEEWDKQAAQEKAKLERKRKFEARSHKNDGDEHHDKKPKPESENVHTL